MTRILFVCRQNAGRSQMAEAFAAHYGKDVLTACSAGSEPALSIHPEVVRSMKEKGIDLSQRSPTSVDDLSRDRFDYVVTMGCGDSCPPVKADRIVAWNVDDPADLPQSIVDGIRDMIEKKVLELIRALKEEQEWKRVTTE